MRKTQRYTEIMTDKDMAALVRRGDHAEICAEMKEIASQGEVGKSAQLLVAISLPPKRKKTTPGQASLFRACQKIINQEVAGHARKQHLWLASAFLTNPETAPAISPGNAQYIISHLSQTSFPSNDSDVILLAEHFARGRDQAWVQHNLPEHLLCIASTLKATEDEDLQTAFFNGISQYDDSFLNRVDTLAQQLGHTDYFDLIREAHERIESKKAAATRPATAVIKKEPESPTRH